VKVYIAGVNP